MTHPVTPPNGADRPSNGRSILGPDPATTADLPVHRPGRVPTRTRCGPRLWTGPLTGPAGYRPGNGGVHPRR